MAPSAPDPQPPPPARVVELVVNLDDVSAEIVGDAVQALLDEGALDAWTTPIGMKKQRPATQFSVLVAPEMAPATARRVLELTGSFGVRFREWDRLVLDRESVDVQTPHGSVAVKVGRLGDRVLTAQPEFESVRRVAQAAGLPPRRVMDAARAAAQLLLSSEETTS